MQPPLRIHYTYKCVCACLCVCVLHTTICIQYTAIEDKQMNVWSNRHTTNQQIAWSCAEIQELPLHLSHSATIIWSHATVCAHSITAFVSFRRIDCVCYHSWAHTHEAAHTPVRSAGGSIQKVYECVSFSNIDITSKNSNIIDMLSVPRSNAFTAVWNGQIKWLAS